MFKLSGEFKELKKIPSDKKCPECSAKDLYFQPDFRKSFGLSVIVFFSIITFYFNYLELSWLITWSPMLLALIFDRYFALRSPLALVCYDCQLIFRGLSDDLLKENYDPFDLETYERYEYKQSLQETS